MRQQSLEESFFPNRAGRGRGQENGRGRGHGRGGGRGHGRGRDGGHDINQERGRGRGRGRGHSQYQISQRRQNLSQTAAETLAVLPALLADLPGFNTTESTLYALKDLAPLDPKHRPGISLSPSDPDAGKKGTRIRVYDQDTFDAALVLQPNTNYTTLKAAASTNPASEDNITTTTNNTPPGKPVAVMNLASERHPGGGFLTGALAQEEALCYRSSLALSLHPTYYPLPSLSAIYSPSILIIRTALSTGHTLLSPGEPARALPIASVLSVAGLRHPELTPDKKKFKHERDRETTKAKIRLTLRIAAREGHRKLVLGALGCGVFGNPPQEVANCFLEVLREYEFEGGWWEDIVFAILDNAKGDQAGKDGSGNFGVFYRALDGQIV